jgi:hypothetical protein
VVFFGLVLGGVVVSKQFACDVVTLSRWHSVVEQYWSVGGKFLIFCACRQGS